MATIPEATRNSIPVIKTKLKGLIFPKEITNLIAEKRKFRRKWQQSINPHDKIKHIKQSSTIKFPAELTQDSSIEYSLWKVAKYPKWPIAQVPPVKSNWARNNLEKSNIFAQNLENRFRPTPGLDTLPVLNLNCYLGKIPLVTPREVAEEIRTKLNSKTHLDLISSQLKFLTLKKKHWSN
jgi:hypothetical protein